MIIRKRKSFFKRLWTRIFLRRVHFNDSYSKMNALYIAEDPWNMGSLSQQHRFSETNKIILDNFGKVNSLLEIGCGEGHQSVYLQAICKKLIGIDVSRRAIERARRRCPGSQFLVGDVYNEKLNDIGPFDLIVACEVLYYLKDLDSVLERIRSLSHNGLITYYKRMARKLDSSILTIPGAMTELIEFDSRSWRAIWWRGKVKSIDECVFSPASFVDDKNS
jgi:SAM-dependent methyltransferase